MKIFTPKSFLQIGGTLLLLFGVLGILGVMGPAPEDSLFGSLWWFTNIESFSLITVGIAFLIAALIFPPVWQRYFVILFGIIALIIGLYSFVNPRLFGAHFETPADLILYLVLGAWGLYSAFAQGLKK